ncbi:DNA-binding transcriptional LysR family regulator [Sinorhizobium fredii]
MEQPNLKELEAIIAIARRGTFRAAAIDLGMSTTALSHTVGRLEAGLGVRLFNRTTRSVSLTDAGRLFMQQVAPSLQDLRTALETVRSQRETPSGTIAYQRSTLCRARHHLTART